MSTVKHIPEEKVSVTDNWFVAAFGEWYPVVYAHRTVETAVPEANFAAKAVGLKGSDSALDLCCGAGRHLVTLQGYGAHLTGLDYSVQLLEIARKRLNRNTDLVRADMRLLPFAGCFDVVFSFFTSFGYFMEDDDNNAAALNMARVLKPAGRFFMDYLNPLNVERQLQPETSRQSQGFTIRERRWIDYDRKRVNKQVVVLRDDTVVGTTSESVRMYQLEELTALLESAGLQVSNVWGDCSGSNYDEDADRMVLAGSKAGA